MEKSDGLRDSSVILVKDREEDKEKKNGVAVEK